MSANGSFMAAAVSGGTIYTSTDGATFAAAAGAPVTASWTTMTMSGDGSTILACVNPGPIYRSNNYGATFANTSAPSNMDWCASRFCASVFSPCSDDVPSVAPSFPHLSLSLPLRPKQVLSRVLRRRVQDRRRRVLRQRLPQQRRRTVVRHPLEAEEKILRFVPRPHHSFIRATPSDLLRRETTLQITTTTTPRPGEPSGRARAFIVVRRFHFRKRKERKREEFF